MKAFRIGPIAVAVSLIMLASLVAGILWNAGPSVKDTRAADRVRVEPPTVPESHQIYLAALQKRRRLDYKDQTVDACLHDLSQSLGMKVQFHESAMDHVRDKGTATFATTEPVSHQTAIRVVMQHFGFYHYGIVFGDDQLTLVVGDKYHGPSLQTYDLMGRSDFSTAVRQREIESTLSEVHPDSWSAANKTWIQPGESVYEIDVYQSQAVHKDIRKRMTAHHSIVTLYEDVQSISFFGLIEQQKTGKALNKEAVVRRLRKKYAYESMADRLTYEAGKKRDGAPKLSVAAQERIQELNEQFEKFKNTNPAFYRLRSESLRKLHEVEVDSFVGRPGQGLGRMPSPGPSYLPGSPPRKFPLASNEMIRSSSETPLRLPDTKTAAAARRVFLPSQQSLREFHRNGEMVFLSTQSFGYIKNRNEVAGFQSHGFAHAPQLLSHMDRPWYRKEKELWAMHRLELVSLLKHEKPAVYASRNLPSMEELKNTDTRALSTFEHSALQQLRDGEDVVTKASLNRIAMMGSLRATNQCLQCHDVKHGALLGAFSYELLRDPQLNPEKHRGESGIKPVF